MDTGQMLAVRLPPEVVGAVKDYATDEGKSIKAVVEEFMRFGLAQSSKQAFEIKQKMDDKTKKQLFSEYRQAVKRGEVIKVESKQMLVARLPPDLMDAIRNYAIKAQKNIVLIVEEFIYLSLDQKKDVLIDRQALASRLHSPYRERPKHKSIAM